MMEWAPTIMSASLPLREELDVEAAVTQARAALERHGLLLFSDPALPSLVGLVVGEPLRSSWWGHPRGNAIYLAMNRLDDDPDVLSTKLVTGKVTYVHRRLWTAVVTVGVARDGWQMDRLSLGARWLLRETDAEGEVHTDGVVAPPDVRAGKRVADFARELERRLLVHTSEIHTPSGAHARVLQTWQRWSREVSLEASSLSAAQGRKELEAAAERLAAEVPDGVARLPWRPARPRRPAHHA
jgi:hypothetical protein